MNWQAEIEEHCFVIEYEVKRPVFGPSAFVTEWVRWGTYKTAAERDAELERLRNGTDARTYRGREFHPWENRRIAY